MKRFFLLLSFFLFSVSSAGATDLSAKIASMTAGTWAVLTPAPSNKSSINSFSSPINFSDGAAWNPINKKYYFLGAGDHTQEMVFMQWTDSTNAWARGSNPPGITGLASGFCNGGWGHSNDGLTIDPATGDFYYAMGQDIQDCISAGGVTGHTLYRFPHATQTWEALSDNPSEFTPGVCCTAIVWWPNLGASGSILLWEGGTGIIYRRDKATGAWSTFANPGTGGGTWLTMEYNPIQNLVYLLFQDASFKSLNSSGTITAKASAPVGPYDGTGFNGHLTYEPGTGKMMLIGAQNFRTAYLYDPVANSWGSPIPNQPVPTMFANTGTMIAGAPVAEYNAIVYGVCSTTTDTSSCLGDLLIYKSTGTLGSTPTADADFATRCAAPGVVRCQPFNTEGAFGSADVIRLENDSVHGNLRAANDGLYYGSIDTAERRSGAGSLKFQMKAGNAFADIAGSYICCGSTGVPPSDAEGIGGAFGENTTWYVQYAVKFSETYFTNQSSGWNSTPKIAIFHHNGASCAAKEITTNQFGTSRWITAYTNCGTLPNNTGAALNTTLDGFTWTNETPLLQQQGDYFCQYGDWTDCFQLPSNKWITLYYKIHNGDWANWTGSPPGTPANTTFEAWYSIDGGAYVKWLNVTANGFILCDGTYPCSGETFNNITLTPYMSFLTTPASVDAFVRYDELIVSTQPIAAPGTLPADAGGADVTPPVVAITTPTTNPTFSTSSSPLTIAGTASDDVALSSVSWSNSLGGSGTASGTTSWSFSLSTPTLLISDVFTGANDLLLSSHTISPTNTPSTSWTLSGCGAEGSCTSKNFLLFGNQVRADCSACSGVNRFLGTVDTGVNSATLAVTVRRSGGSADASNAGFTFRYLDADNLWIASLAFDGTLKIYEKTAGAYFERASAASAFAVNTDYALALVLSGNSISLTKDGGAALTFSSSVGATRTKMGIGAHFVSAATVTLDGFTVTSGATLFTGDNVVTVTAFDSSSNPSTADIITVTYSASATPAPPSGFKLQ